MRKSLWSSGVRWGALVLAAAMAFACGGETEQAAQGGEGRGAGAGGGRATAMMGMMGAGAAIPVEVRPVDRGDIAVSLLTYTTIEAERHVDVIARTQGLVKTIYVEEGQTVTQGQPLAQLDEEALKLQVREREINMQNLKATLDRAAELRDKELISSQEYEQTRFNYEGAKTQYESAKLNLEYATIRAPFSGIVSGRLIEVGNLVNANQAVFRIADFNPLLARIFVPERQIRQVKVGQSVRISVEGTDQVYTGRVRMISPVVDPASGTIKVTVEIDDRTRTLRPGMFATVNIITEVHQNALRVEKKALVSEAEGTFAFLYNGGSAQKTRLELGFSEGNWVEVLAGLTDGDSVITVGHEGLRNGAPVRLVGQPVAPPPVAAGERPAENPGPRRNPQSMQGGGQGVQGMRGGMDLNQMKERLFQNPEIKAAYEQRAKEDPEFEKNEEKQRRFFREMFMQMRSEGGGGRGFGRTP